MMTQLLLATCLIILIYVSTWYIISLALKRSDIVDIAWGGGYVLLTIYYLLSTELSIRGLLLSVLVIAWGTRLAIYILLRNRNKGEDFRYNNWRKTWKNFYIRSYFQIFILQGLLLIVIILPLTVVMSDKQPPLNLLDLAGLLIWLGGFLIESIADYQLTRFKSKESSRGKIMKSGLWRYSRHPNYFGEVMLWWGIFLISLSSPCWYYGIASPLLITYLILFVSGIPMLEEKYKNNPEYKEYSKITSKFLPLPPKK